MSHRDVELVDQTEFGRSFSAIVRISCHVPPIPVSKGQSIVRLQFRNHRPWKGLAMHNPFTEIVDESTGCELIEQAKNGSKSAVEKLVLRHQAWIYNIAIRMVFYPQDAEEVTQEVLIKAITRLTRSTATVSSEPGSTATLKNRIYKSAHLANTVYCFEACTS